ncbi:cupin domain-containing protein [Pollutibacter soli]|uniref:cupin domain-containing protein n=1 Tax=Pollutibacter soli TaxID=3034157 RepID=UPI003013E561
MNYTYPHKIENFLGEKITILERKKETHGDRLIVESYTAPGVGPVMHTHWLQDESLTVVKGTIGYQVKGQSERFAKEGETILFSKGTPHRFWNAGKETLYCRGYIKPAHSIEFFLTSIFEAQNKARSKEPEPFDAAFLLTKYSSEFDLTEIPVFVKKAILPLMCIFGKLLGKYKHFKNAPPAVKSI